MTSGPREEALRAVLAVREEVGAQSISESTWADLIALAWDNRSQVGERRELRREIRKILVQDSPDLGDF